MSKKLCKQGLSINKPDKKLKYFCKKCDLEAVKEKHCCKPVKKS